MAYSDQACFVGWLRILLVVVLLGCFFPWSYTYFYFLRMLATVFCVLFAIDHIIRIQIGRALFMLVMAGLFQPFFMIILERHVWLIIDVGLAVFLLYEVYGSSKAKKSTKTSKIVRSLNQSKLDDSHYQ